MCFDSEQAILALSKNWFFQAGCGSTSIKSKKISYTFSAEGWKASYVSDFLEVAGSWPVAAENQMLSAPFLAAQAGSLPASLRPRFLVLEDGQGPAVWASLQVVSFNAAENIRETAVWEGTSGYLRKQVARLGNFKLLICGNLFSVGENGWMVRADLATDNAFFKVFTYFLKQAARCEGVQVLVFKDFAQELPALQATGFHPLSFQPNMVLPLDNAWKTADDYLEAMTSKYRVRARRAFRKADDLEFRELSLPEIEWNAHQLAELYQEVVLSSGFSLATAGADYFPGLKAALGSAYRVVGVYRAGELIAFYSTIHNGKRLEAHFIGFRQVCNKDCQLYLNMLYRMVSDGIRMRVSEIIFARTALEIKSSVGAVARPAHVYMAHISPVLNRFLPWAVRWLEPREVWTPRHPFHVD